MKAISSVVCPAFFVLLFASRLFAGWSEPVFLTELNDNQSSVFAARPTISSDENIIYFVRDIPPKNYYLWEAKRDPQTGLFTSQRVVTELGMDQGRPIYSTWLSPDSLRLYASITRYNQSRGRWENPIYLAVRNTVEDKWKLSSTVPVISYGESDGSQSLTADELLILWESRPAMESPFTIYEAKRNSIGASFGNIRQVSELNAFGAHRPAMTSDGLCVYFSKIAPSGYFELWRGFRNSLAEPFGNFEPLVGVNRADVNNNEPSISPDGRILYFFRGAPWLSAAERGIYVSYWVDDPYEIAVGNLLEAIELKRQAKELLDNAMDKEIEAMEMLSLLRPQDLPDGVTVKDFRLARVGLLQAIQRQIIARMNINSSLGLLNKVMLCLTPPVAEPTEVAEPRTKVVGLEKAQIKTDAAKNAKK